MENELITSPCFVFKQGDTFGYEDGDQDFLVVKYYADGIGVSQNDQEIYLSEKYLKQLFTAINKNKPKK